MAKIKQAEFKINELQVISEAVNKSKELSQKYTDKRLKSISSLMVGVVIVCFLAFIQLVVDSFHINNATYREYSQKTDVLNQLSESNKVLMERNKELMINIVELQTEIKNMLTVKK